MQINTNYNPSFNANLKLDMKVAKPGRLLSIQKRFMEATKDHPKDTLYITRDLQEANSTSVSMHLSNAKEGDMYKSTEIYSDNFDLMMEKMSDSDIVKKLDAIFRAEKLHGQAEKAIEKLTDSINKLLKKAHLHEFKAKVYQEEGKDIYAKQHAYIFNSMSEKADIMQSKLCDVKKYYNKEFDRYSEIYPEIAELKF